MAFVKNFESLIETASDGALIVDQQKIVVSANGILSKMFGYKRSELVGLEADQLFLKNVDSANVYFEDVELSSLAYSGEIEKDVFGIGKNGRKFPVDAMFTLMQKEGTQYFIGFVKKRILRNKEDNANESLSRIFNASLNEIYIFDAETLKFINANKGAQLNLGYSIGELKELNPAAISAFDEEEVRELIGPLLKQNDKKIAFEATHYRKNGTSYPVEVHLQSSVMDGKLTILAIIWDISEQKSYISKLQKNVKEKTEQLREALRKEKELNQLQRKFLTLVSHEFKTPLSGILTSAHLISKYPTAYHQEKRSKHVDIIKFKVEYLNNILNEFLLLERLDLGKVNYKLSFFNLSKVVNEVVYDSSLLLKGGQKIHISENADEFDLYQDEHVLQVILSHLVVNAIKYSPEESQIQIEVERNDNNITIEVIDEGIGIPEKDQEFIFNRYYRGENVLYDQGTGIGLNIVQAHLENLGGTITFTSAENMGSTFIVALPIEAIIIESEQSVS